MAPTTITGITAKRAMEISARLTTLGALAIEDDNDCDAVRAFTAAEASVKLAELRGNLIRRGEPELVLKTFRSDEKVDYGALINSCLNFFADCGSDSDDLYSWLEAPGVADVAFPHGTFERSRAAIEAMPSGDHVATLTACGDLFVALQEWRKAVAVYRVIGAHERLVDLGERLFRADASWQDLPIAFEAYSAAGVAEEYFAHGERALETFGLDRAIMIYAAGRRPVPEGLIEPYARRFVRRGQMRDARRAYSDGCQRPFPRALLLEGMQVFLDSGDLEVARSLAMEAGVTLTQDQLVACGTTALSAGHLIVGREAFAASGQSIPSELLIACGERALQEGDRSDAIEALAAALTGSFDA